MNHNPAFDGIRALAVLPVVAYHCFVPGFTGGFFGVDVFFVLSGFLITSLLNAEVLDTGDISLRRFYVRRLLRLGPPLVLMLAVYLAVAPLAWPSIPTRDHFLHASLAALYLSDYSQAWWGIPEVLRHTWSLSVEEHYYLLWPLLGLWLLRAKRQTQIAVLILLFWVATLWRIVDIVYFRDWPGVYYRFDARISGLILGGLLSVLSQPLSRIPKPTADGIGLAGTVAFAGCCATFETYQIGSYIWGVTLAEFSAAALIVAAANSQTVTHRLLSLRGPVYIGVLSYGIYLWHAPIALWVEGFLPWDAAFAVVLTTSVGLASTSYMLLEQPIRRYRNTRWGRAATATVT